MDAKYDETKISITSAAYPIFRLVSAGVGWPQARSIYWKGTNGVYPGIWCNSAFPGIDSELPDIIGGPCSMLASEFQLVESDNLTFVLKNVDALRSISVGPTGCVYLQLGIGREMERRLERWGIYLSNQTLNSDLARYGSFSGAVATVDLKTASNLISRKAVEYFFPPRIFWAMDQTRVPTYEYEGVTSQYHMFSGMGNGYTFPMQTVLFHALATACCDVVGVSNALTATYGDDIVIPVQAYELLKKVFAWCGFVINEAKSFATGSFRESCGGQFFNGRDIRPVFWKGFKGKSITAQEVCKLSHLLVLWRDRLHDHVPFELTATLRFLKDLAFRLDPKCPKVPINAPVGTGFPEPWCALDNTSLRVYEFEPVLRDGREDAMCCYALDGGLKHVGNPNSITDGFPKGKPSAAPEVPVFGQGRWRVVRRRFMLGEYIRDGSFDHCHWFKTSGEGREKHKGLVWAESPRVS